MEETNSCSPGEDLICETCGDKGFTNAFVYCVKCLGSVIHRYCLDATPSTYDELAPWFCEDCKPAEPKKFTLTKPKSTGFQKEEDPSSVHVAVTRPKKKRRKERNIASLVAETGGVNCLEETKEPDGECIPYVVAGTEPAKLDGKRRPLRAARNRKRKRLSSKTRKDRLQNSITHVPQKSCSNLVDSIEHSLSDSSPSSVCFKNEKGLAYSVEQQRDESQSSQPPCETNKRLDLTEYEKVLSDSSSMEKESDKKTKDHECVAETAHQVQTGQDTKASSADFASNLQQLNYLHARPVIDPVWRGSFNILHTDYDLFEGFVAHVSSKACEKVFEEANMLPSLLCLEMHPKSVLWPKSFQECEPTDENIALYFFPGNSENERSFDDLVLDIMDQGLAMRATAKNAELLIFASKDLPRLYWRFQGKHYLWGVFKGKRKDSLPVMNYDQTVLNNDDRHDVSENSQNEVISGKKTLKRMKTLDAQSPQSPLCNIGENAMDMDPDSGD